MARGGLAVHLAMVAMGGELGMETSIADIPSSAELSDTQILYSESAGRFVVTVNPAKREAFEALFTGMDVGCIGLVTESPRFSVRDSKGAAIMDEEISELKNCWKRPFGGLI